MASQKDEEANNGPKKVDQVACSDVGKDEVEMDNLSRQQTYPESQTNTGGLAGVERVEAMTKTWTKPWLIVAYALYDQYT